MEASINNFWEDDEQVKKFAERDPDHRFMELIKIYDEPQTITVLDLGCAGGRNTVILAERGFQFRALDASAAMIRKTRQRVGALIGPEKAAEYVRQGNMDDLSSFPDHFFDFIIALGVYHNALSQAQWDRTLGESARVIKSGGRLLVSNFGPDSQPEGLPLIPHKNEPNVYDGFGPGPLYLIDAATLDREMERFGFKPLQPTETVVTATEKGRRVTINGLYMLS